MSIDNLQLDNFTIQNLFENSLVGSISSPKIQPANSTQSEFLGSNKKRVSIFVNNPHELFLPEAELVFLNGILLACKLTLEDVAITNFNSEENTYTQYTKALKPSVVLLFGVTSLQLDLPFSIPDYQVQIFNLVKCINATSLNNQQNNV